MSGEVEFRLATQKDQPEIDQIQREVFGDEQGIPKDMLGIDEEKQPIWFVAVRDGEVIGTTAAWKENGKTHFGRFALKPSCRGQHIGTKFIHFAFDYLFNHGETLLDMECREVSVHIINAMGGEVTGEPFPFFKGGTCTPMVLEKDKFH